MNREARLEAVTEGHDAARRRRIESARRALAASGAKECADCGEPIPEPRRKAAPFARRCAACQSECEREFYCR
ncbi:TraR/DksA C4-type zinc finger protein [Martelella mediterranea]|uniref:TraR/DksA C4-type zinc finger protein n=1 Tax=Martelella mediterranea TaxID=293089 RepID=UPI001E2EB218|nr:TraR/DksA C4-type zinc finger protein [Martelella mediterranea]MCD1634474.1 TraR/DksA C4-type zinc finger protein [Martelella mediterranea]